MQFKSIDVYVTYRCNLRCNHCFVGEDLNTSLTMPFESFTNLIDAAKGWKTDEITFLGGEPTLYPHIMSAIDYVLDAGMRPRLVTNGGAAFKRLLSKLSSDIKPTVYFSVDGSRSEVHDRVRGDGSFKHLSQSIELAGKSGWRRFGIFSISKSNVDDVINTLRFCKSSGLEHVNVHYVTARGFATDDIVLSLTEWGRTRRLVEETALDIGLHVRMDNGLSPHGEYKGYCALRDESNLMVTPDGRAFMCALFWDVEGAESFRWTGTDLVRSTDPRSEIRVAEAHVGAVACPAAMEYNRDGVDAAHSMGATVGCLYEKVDIADQRIALRR
jgi:MoaA/NifB/PqqE/SkfB family radical SAM enzyme